VVASDPCGGGNRVSLRLLRTYLTSAPEVEPEAFDVCPLLLAHPAADTWTPVALSRPFFERLACDKELVLLDGAGHFPIEQPGLSQLEQAFGAFADRVLHS
jgi:alpha-beta hydrolase superfamily lysophospholipase